MKAVEDVALWASLRPRKVHSLPGRLRLRIPLLANLSAEWVPVAGMLERVIAAPEGVGTVRLDRRTGSILIEYDPRIRNETDIQNYLGDLLDLLRRHRRQLIRPDRTATVRIAGNLERWVTEHTRRKPCIDPKAELPDEVWKET